MTTSQLIVLGLLVVAFVSGWVARGSGAPEPSEPTGPQAGGDPGHEQTAPAGATPLLREVAARHEEVIDAWIDGLPPDAPLAAFEAAAGRWRTAVDASQDPALVDAMAALDESAAVFEQFRSGTALSADASRRLEAAEERVAQALSQA